VVRTMVKFHVSLLTRLTLKARTRTLQLQLALVVAYTCRLYTSMFFTCQFVERKKLFPTIY
jgi:hypothetical protein